MQEVFRLDAENKRLYELLGSYPDKKRNFLFADIIATSSVPDRHQIIINKGSTDGVNIGDAVADPNGIIGHVIRDQVFFSSEILLISDLEHAIPIEITSTGERAIAYGSGEMNRLEIRSISLNSKVQKGDAVITSGLGGRYPEVSCGEISRVNKIEGENLLAIDLSPFANLDVINEIWVIQTEVSEDE